METREKTDSNQARQCQRMDRNDMINAKAKELKASGRDCHTGSGSQMHGRFPAWKRTLDLFCIIISLPLWLPLMLFIALGILLVSPGPVFFRQERVGFHGRRFSCWKFRSMKTNAETKVHEKYLEQLMRADCPMRKLDSSDPRLIPLGRIFRASGLDELPQIFNVIRGEMSLVGPRPCTSNEAENYTPDQKERFNAPPGLTGYWQVNGKNKTTFREMIAMDIYYAAHMSVWLDISIMLKTIPSIANQLIEPWIAKYVKTEPAESFEKQVS